MNASLQISVPSKTFLLGEYAVLQEGSAILLATSPRFNLQATQQRHPKINLKGIPLESPAGKLVKRDADFYQNYQISFMDPYQGLGGFGASSAQFVMISALKYFVQGKILNDFDLLEEYKKLAWDGEGVSPSGADLIAQIQGGVCFFQLLKKQVKVFSWPFSDIGYCLIHTGNKLATHLHLKKHSYFDTAGLEKMTQTGLFSLEQSDSERFVVAIKKYAQILQEKNLVAEHTQKILKQLSACPDILVAKGCGALGADVVLVIFNKKMRDEAIAYIKEKKLAIISYGQEVAQGIEIQKGEA